MAKQAVEGKALRINFKCGWLTIKDGLIQWQHSRELLQ
jgi:hypothetical protein